MAEAIIEKLFGKNGRVLVKDGEFNNVQGNYYHYDSSQRITNHGCYNVIGNNLNNVSNHSQVIHHGSGVRSMHHDRSATHRVATVNATTRNNHASAQPCNAITQPHLQASLSSGFPFPQRPGRNLYTQGVDMRPMTPAERAHMHNEMLQMKQEMDAEFCDEEEEQNAAGPEMYNDDTPEDEMPQSLSSDFHRLTISGERVSASPRSALIQGPSPNAVQANRSPRYTNITHITGNYTEVDDRLYQYDINSHCVRNNVIENSFGEGIQEVLAQTAQIRNFRQNFFPRRR